MFWLYFLFASIACVPFAVCGVEIGTSVLVCVSRTEGREWVFDGYSNVGPLKFPKL